MGRCCEQEQEQGLKAWCEAGEELVVIRVEQQEPSLPYDLSSHQPGATLPWKRHSESPQTPLRGSS